MTYCRVTALVIVEERHLPEVTETLLSAIDSLVIQGIPVFDSVVSSNSDVEVQDAEDIISEMRPVGVVNDAL